MVQVSKGHKRTQESNVAQPFLGGLELAVARAREDEGRRPRVHAEGARAFT